MGRKLSLLIAAVVIGTIIYAGVVTWKPVVGETVGNVLNDQVAKPGGLAIGNLASAVVSSPIWKTYIAPTANAFAIGIGTCLVLILLLRKVKLPSIFGKAQEKVYQHEPTSEPPQQLGTASTKLPTAKEVLEETSEEEVES